MTLVRDIGSWTPHQVKNFLIDYQKYVNYIKDNIIHYKTFSSLPGLIKTYLNPILEYHMKHNSQKDCGCGVSHFAVLPTGVVAPCERFTRTNSLELLKKRDVILSKCNTCEITHICHKGCIHEQLINNGPIEELCEIYKGINNILKRFIHETGYYTLKLFKKENY